MIEAGAPEARGGAHGHGVAFRSVPIVAEELPGPKRSGEVSSLDAEEREMFQHVLHVAGTPSPFTLSAAILETTDGATSWSALALAPYGAT